jgi:effector-binding domain-containing protein
MLMLPVRGSYAQFDGRVNQVKKYIQKEKIETTGRWMCLNFSDPASDHPADFQWQVGCEIEPRAGLTVNPPYELQYHERDTVASAVFDGPPRTEFPYTSFILQNLTNGYMIAGPLTFTWKEDPRKTVPKVEKTEVLMKVVRLEGFSKAMEAFGRGMAAWAKSLSGVSEKTAEEDQLMEERKKVEFHTQAMEIRLKEEQEKSGSEKAAGDGKGPEKTGWKEKVSEFLRQSSESEGTKHPWILRKTDPYWAILLPATGSMDQQTVVFEKLRNYMNANGITPLGLPFMRQYYSGRIVQAFELRWEAGYRINDSVSVKSPFLVVRVPERQILAVHYTQSLDQKLLNVQLASWLYHNEYRTRMPQVISWSGGIPRTMAELKTADAELPVEKMDKPYLDVRLFTRSDTDRRELLMPMTGGWKQEDEAVLKLKKYIQENKIETLGDVFIQYHLSPELTPEKDLVWEVGVPVREDVRTTGSFRTEWRHGRLLACTNFEGDHLNIPDDFWWSYALSYTMSGYMAAGYPRKVLQEQLPGNKWRVELQWPVSQ